MAMKAICPSCGEWVGLSAQPAIGEQVTCVHCEADLEVVELEPVELDWAYYDEDDEDWDDEDWDDEDWDDEDDEDWDSA